MPPPDAPGSGPGDPEMKAAFERAFARCKILDLNGNEVPVAKAWERFLFELGKAAPLTAEWLWKIHRAALGGKSSATGAVLPEELSGAPAGAQAAHWAMALAVAEVMGRPEPPVPAAVSVEDVARVRSALAAPAT